jgi:hypothetical protein
MPIKSTNDCAVPLSGAQLRAARGLLNMSVSQLAELTRLALNTIKKAEAADGPIPLKASNAKLLQHTLEECGVVFVDADGELGPGVRLSGDGPRFVGARRRSATAVQSS